MNFITFKLISETFNFEVLLFLQLLNLMLNLHYFFLVLFLVFRMFLQFFDKMTFFMLNMLKIFKFRNQDHLFNFIRLRQSFIEKFSDRGLDSVNSRKLRDHHGIISERTSSLIVILLSLVNVISDKEKS